MALTFTYSLTALGESTNVMRNHGSNVGTYGRLLRFSLAPSTGRDAVCRATGERVSAGRPIVRDVERDLEYCAHCANNEVGGVIISVTRG